MFTALRTTLNALCYSKSVRIVLICLASGSLQANADAPKISGLQFPVGEPADRPAAKVKIEEISQGAQKRGFFRISILPLMVAKGVEIRLQRPDIGALAEIRKTLLSLAKLDAQEFQKLSIFCGDEKTPRLIAELATPTDAAWALKRARIKTAAGFREAAECTLHITGEHAGQCLGSHLGGPLQLDLSTTP